MTAKISLVRSVCFIGLAAVFAAAFVVRIYSKALSAAEALQLYNQGK